MSKLMNLQDSRCPITTATFSSPEAGDFDKSAMPTSLSGRQILRRQKDSDV